ncbi:hypothetical protein V1478_001248 [Vespula squamosa]|uniref:Uncharacterized protein n=1 Tax=Vespula squamosa TaxID=30214 RepID=A0ABD2BVS6_VESSQ
MEDQDAHFRHNLLQERVASTQEVMCRIWERSVERKAASELRKMTERIRLMTDGGNQMEEIECAKKKKRKRWDYQAIRKGWSQAVRSESIPRTDKL